MAMGHAHRTTPGNPMRIPKGVAAPGGIEARCAREHAESKRMTTAGRACLGVGNYIAHAAHSRRHNSDLHPNAEGGGISGGLLARSFAGA